MFEGVTRHRIETSQSTTISLVTAGTGEGLLHLHGCPETLVMWHKIAPAFADDFAVVASDLRGYGDSSKPPGASYQGQPAQRGREHDGEPLPASDIRRRLGPAVEQRRQLVPMMRVPGPHRAGAWWVLRRAGPGL
jgi:pimeloyl-ACP methyl ester carboxylesterase